MTRCITHNLFPFSQGLQLLFPTKRYVHTKSNFLSDVKFPITIPHQNSVCLLMTPASDILKTARSRQNLKNFINFSLAEYRERQRCPSRISGPCKWRASKKKAGEQEDGDMLMVAEKLPLGRRLF